MRLRGLGARFYRHRTALAGQEDKVHHTYLHTRARHHQPGGGIQLPAYGISVVPRLLLVDDDQSSLSLWEHIFRLEGYSVTTVCVSEDAAHLDMRAFDLAIIDFDMPGCDGRTLLLRMRAAGAAFPVILLSGSIDTLPKETLVLFSKRTPKPVGCCELLASVSAFLNAAPDSPS